MQPPISLGTLLQQRYRVTKILGQGGFGRTYLAQDTGCFDEMCVLKEFSPTDRGRDAMKKSKELFQREAQVLYQINHPQIPKFRANFEEQKRLFLVQEYAEGKTVAKTLSERLKNSTTFNEAEAVKFLQDMLPVLTHIHNMGIIHRDISPDNIIFRDRDKLPVLIDFGVVKAGVTQLEVSTQIHQGTTVGKAGYAPGEQLQTGEAYANSDLYALAVTVVVMMTGRKPESLIDKSTMTWKWHQWVPTLTPWFAKILNKMLSRVPNSRYQSANEVLQALRSVADLIGSTTAESDAQSLDELSPAKSSQRPSAERQGTLPNNRSNVPLSRGRRTSSIQSNAKPHAKPQKQNPLRGVFNSPWGVAFGSAIAFAIVLLPLFLIIRALLTPPDGSKTPSTSVPTPAPAISTAPIAESPIVTAPVPSPVASTATPIPTAVTENLALEVGKPSIKEGTLDPTRPTIISLGNLTAGQKLKVSLTVNPPGATMNVMAPNQANVDVYAKNTLNWEGNLPLAGEYRVEIASPPGSAASNYKVEVSLVNATTGTTTPVASPTASPTPLATPALP
jgi:serine/threonine protein kinase